jgi:hypothetical protein
VVMLLEALDKIIFARHDISLWPRPLRYEKAHMKLYISLIESVLPQHVWRLYGVSVRGRF